jgi:hypothetical protein
MRAHSLEVAADSFKPPAYFLEALACSLEVFAESDARQNVLIIGCTAFLTGLALFFLL